MRSDELAVEQFRSSAAQSRHQPCERDLGRIALAAEHAFAAEHAVEADAIEPADQLAPAPAFDRMRLAEFVKPLVARGDAVADPAFAAAVAPRRRAVVHHIGESAVARHREPPAPQGPGKRAGEMEAVEREDRAFARLYPENLRVVAMVGHGKDAAAISEHQQVRVYDRWRSGGVHAASLAKPADKILPADVEEDFCRQSPCHRPRQPLEAPAPAGV